MTLACGISASAAAAETVYPQKDDFVFSLTFTDLKDYAVSDGAFAFVDGNTVKVYETDTLDESGENPVYKNGALTEYNGFDVTVASIDYKDGAFYYADGNGKVYSLPDKTAAENVTLTQSKTWLLNEDTGYMYTIGESSLSIYKAGVGETQTEGSFSQLKQYGESVYAISDNQLCKFTGSEMEIAGMQYVDFSPAKTVSVGNAAEQLKNYTLAFVDVAEGSFMTEVDLSENLTEYFKTGGTSELEEQTAALLLGYTGNAALISIGAKSYITLKTNVTESSDGSEFKTTAEFTRAQVLGDAIYASPFVMECVYAKSDARSVIVNVTGKLHNDLLWADFYEVEYTYESNGKTESIKGYVIAGLLSGDNVNESATPTENPDEHYTEKDNVRTVLLVLMVVILVLIVISYLIWLATSDKRRKGKNKSDEK